MRTITPVTIGTLSDKEHRALLLTVERRAKTLVLRSPSAADEAEYQDLIEPPLREFLVRYGRTTPPHIPDLRRAQAYVLTKVTRSTLHEHMAAFAVIACWRLHLGQPELAQAAINGAAATLRDCAPWFSADRRKRAEAMVRHLQNQARMAQGIFPMFPWILNDFIDEMAVPSMDLPHLVLVYCVLSYRFGAKAEALALAEQLRQVIERGEEDGDDVVRLHMEAWILCHKPTLHSKRTGDEPGTQGAGAVPLPG